MRKAAGDDCKRMETYRAEKSSEKRHLTIIGYHYALIENNQIGSGGQRQIEVEITPTLQKPVAG